MDMKVVLIDDEPGAIVALRSMVERYGKGFHVVGEARAALDGIKLIQRERPDLVLLDIEMPHGSGFDLLEAFPGRGFHVIYTTAHEKHAVEAAHTHPFDYLLKPVDPDDLSRALDHLITQRRNGHPDRIEVSSVQGKAFINVDDILRVEADGGYSTIHTQGGEKHVDRHASLRGILIAQQGGGLVSPHFFDRPAQLFDHRHRALAMPLFRRKETWPCLHPVIHCCGAD
jgi:two-component system, LytTR family, response regulator